MIVRARRARAAVPLVAALGVAFAPACKGTPTLGFSLSVPSGVASKVAWYEVGVFSGTSCATLAPQLSGGVPASGYVERIAFQSGDATPPILADLPRAKYAVAVAARAADCSVLADGCDDADLTSNHAVTVTLDDGANPPLGACVSGASCNDGRCADGTDNGAPSVGAGCSLELIGAGPLADPLLLGGGTIVSAPAIAATADGFLIAYREDDTTDGIARVSVIPVQSGGGALGPQQAQQMACSETELSDATGVAFSGTSGVVAESRAGCGGNGGFDLFAVDGSGALGTDGFTSEGTDRVLLSTAHAMSQSAAGTFLAYVDADTNVAMIAPVQQGGAAGGIVGAPTPFTDGVRAGDAWVAASDEAVGLVAASTGGAAAPVDDAGTGSDGGGEDAGAPVAPGGQALLVSVVAASDAGASFASLGTPTSFPGTWASVSALDGRVFVASDGQTADQPIAYRAFDVGAAAPAITSGFDTDDADAGPVLYSDVAFHQDHVFFAVERPGSIALVAFDHATTTPTLLREVDLASDARVPSISDVRDGRVAVLATDSRVLVAWTTEELLSSNDATGGYALFACTTP